ncbi:MAG: phosphohistidine phosphatase SixA [Myxococcota bacterium]
MKLYLMRHGAAEDKRKGTPSDFDRALTVRGRKRVREVGRALRDNWVLPDIIVASPIVRALQTAEIVAARLDPDEPVVVRRELAPGGELLPLVGELLRSDLESALLVSHEPGLSRLVSSLLGEDLWQSSFSKGMVVALRVSEDGRSKLLFALDPKQLEPVHV